ncbi:hypothetical protein D3C86_1699180 [compost metagenome]
MLFVQLDAKLVKVMVQVFGQHRIPLSGTQLAERMRFFTFKVSSTQLLYLLHKTGQARFLPLKITTIGNDKAWCSRHTFFIGLRTGHH